MQSNPFRVFTRTLCSIYRQSFIEIRGGHLGRFPRESERDTSRLIKGQVKKPLKLMTVSEHFERDLNEVGDRF